MRKLNRIRAFVQNLKFLVTRRIQVIHFHNGSGGGVLSVIRNLLSHSQNPEIENHVIYTINKEKTPEYELPELKGATSEQVFYFSPKWNFFHTCKQLAKLLPDEKAVVVAHDWLELGMASNLGLQNPVVHFLHGDYEYYYQLAEIHKKCVDRYIAINPMIAEKLRSKINAGKEKIYYRRFPVPEIHARRKESEILRILYCGNDLNSHSKQFEMLPKINAILADHKMIVLWNIIGYGISEDSVSELMKQKENVFVYSNISNERVLQLMAMNDVILLPSIHEGFPVSIVEGMKSGLVPLVTNWDDATGELIKEGESGFYFAVGDAEGYAERIAMLDANREQLKSMSKRAMALANELFDPVENTQRIEQLFVETSKNTSHKEKNRVYGSRLDREWIPNGVVRRIREGSNR